MLLLHSIECRDESRPATAALLLIYLVHVDLFLKKYKDRIGLFLLLMAKYQLSKIPTKGSGYLNNLHNYLKALKHYSCLHILSFTISQIDHGSFR